MNKFALILPPKKTLLCGLLILTVFLLPSVGSNIWASYILQTDQENDAFAPLLTLA